MDNFLVNIQSIKSQIDNIKLQLSNIELQYNNMNGINKSEQLLNLSIQILNTGIQTFNLGKNHTMPSIDNYYNQLKNISNIINSLLDEYNNIQMMNQQMQQMMMYQQMQPEIFPNPMKTKKMNISFIESSGLRLNFVIDYGTKIKDVLDKFSQRVGIPKFNFYFICNRERLKYDDERKIEDYFIDGTRIAAIRFRQIC